MKAVVFLICTFSVNKVLAQNAACLARPDGQSCEDLLVQNRVYFNNVSGKCEAFSGEICAAGSNSFSDWMTCRQTCVCQLPPKPTPCPSSWEETDFTRFYFNKLTNKCEVFPNEEGSCSLNGNYFQSKSDCKMTCVCSLPSDPGSGQADNEAFFFNTQTHRCEEFPFRGQGGNANRFLSEQVCKDECLCGLPLKPSAGEPACLALFRSYFFNSTSQQCQMFFFGGCGGNNNRFSSMALCKDACP